MKYNEELLFGQLYILQSKTIHIFEGGCMPTIICRRIVSFEKYLGSGNNPFPLFFTLYFSTLDVGKILRRKIGNI